MNAGRTRGAADTLRRLIDRAALVCVGQVVAGTIALPFVLATISTDQWPRRGLLFLHALVYACVGVLLCFVVRAEERARTLGRLLLCVAAVFALGSIKGAHELSGTFVAPLALVFAVKADALTPYFAWRFASDFPHVPDSRRSLRMLGLARGVSLVLAAVLIAASVVSLAWGDATGVLTYLTRAGAHSLYFQLQYVLVLAAFVTLVVRARRASLDERRRVSLLVGGIVLGGMPAIAFIILWSLVPGFPDVVPLRYAGWVIYPALLAAPTVAAYAVVSRRAFGMALLVRRAIDHALSRYVVGALLSAPIVLLLLDLYARRETRLADVVSLRDGGIAALLLIASALALRHHRALLERIDRAFFRERYDARHVTSALVDDCRWVATRDELAALLGAGLDRALHVELVRLYLLNARRRQLEPVGAAERALASDSRLAALISAAEESLDFEIDGPMPKGLAGADVAWLADAGAHCIVPLHDARSNLLGFLALGAKRSDLPFTREDRGLLKSVARAAELTLAYHRLCEDADDLAPPERASEGASECLSCGLVVDGKGERCSACDGSLVECLLPALLAGNLRVVARVGGGGMGTVYRALDADLGRSVALKTLPYASPDAAARLRREAHIMASLAHDAVASVYAVHSWEGRPVVAYEFLAEGTLSDRIVRGPLPLTDVLSIGQTLAGGLAAIHAAGLLHGDVKPSNIGFTSGGRPKLLDFGIAAPIQSLGAQPGHPSHAGTLAYLAPDVASGGTPTFDSDIWSLVMTLFEAITGVQPMIGGDFAETMRRVIGGEVPRASDLDPSLPPSVDDLFARAFGRDGRGRLASAHALSTALARVRELIAIGT